MLFVLELIFVCFLNHSVSQPLAPSWPQQRSAGHKGAATRRCPGPVLLGKPREDSRLASHSQSVKGCDRGRVVSGSDLTFTLRPLLGKTKITAFQFVVFTSVMLVFLGSSAPPIPLALAFLSPGWRPYWGWGGWGAAVAAASPPCPL